ncbi:MAG: hypothetical protein WC977_12385 [Anaerovoracaceae bacterium]|jgi:hypothetical protein
MITEDTIIRAGKQFAGSAVSELVTRFEGFLNTDSVEVDLKRTALDVVDRLGELILLRQALQRHADSWEAKHAASRILGVLGSVDDAWYRTPLGRLVGTVIPPHGGVLSPTQASRILGVSRQRVWQMLQEGKLRSSGDRKITAASVMGEVERRLEGEEE